MKIGPETLSLLIGADITLILVNGMNGCGVSTKRVLLWGIIDTLEINLQQLNTLLSKNYLDGTKRKTYANATPIPASHPAYTYLVAGDATSYSPVSLSER